jgi:hypothetical protein
MKYATALEVNRPYDVSFLQPLAAASNVATIMPVSDTNNSGDKFPETRRSLDRGFEILTACLL